MNNNSLLISFTTLVEQSEVPASLDPNIIRPIIREVQDMRVLPVIGSGLYEKLKADIEGDAVAGNYLTLLNDYIRPVMIYGVLSELPIRLNFRPTNAGFVAKTSENAATNSFADLKQISDHYASRREYYANLLDHYLLEHPEDFPEYKSESGIDETRPGNTRFETGVFLGNPRRRFGQWPPL